MDSNKLKRISLDEYDYCKYVDAKEANFDCIEFFYRYNSDAVKSVDAFFIDCEYYMNENGMEKFVKMISGMLFQIQKNDVEPDLAYGMNCDISDFETGEYDDLFTPEDLELIKADIKIIKDYLAKHPELLED